MRALHACAPGRDARLVVGAGRIRVTFVFAARRRAVHLDAVAGCPFGVFVLVEAAIDQMAFWPLAVALFDLLQDGPDQTAVGADRSGFGMDGNRAAGRADDLAIVSRAEAAIGHLHDARLRIGGGDTRLLLLLNLLLVGPFPPLALRLDLRQLTERRRHTGSAFVCGTLFCGRDPAAARLRIISQLAFEPREQPVRLFELLVQLLLAPE